MNINHSRNVADVLEASRTTRRKFLLIIVFVIASIIIISTGLVLLNKNDAKRARSYELMAIPVGLEHAKLECNKEGLDKATCDSLTGDAGTMECSGRNCWVVYVHARDGSLFSSVTVERVDIDANQLQATTYLRNK